MSRYLMAKFLKDPIFRTPLYRWVLIPLGAFAGLCLVMLFLITLLAAFLRVPVF